MKVIYQFGIILGVSFIGEILNQTIPLPIPASIYGLILMFVLLETRLVRFETIEASGVFLKNSLVVTLIPSAVGVMAAWDILGPILLPAVLILVSTNLLVFAAAGHTAQAIVRLSRRGKAKGANAKGGLDG